MLSSHAPRPVLITGASGGIGADLARVFARAGHRLALAARSRDKLEALAAELPASGNGSHLAVAVDLQHLDGPSFLAQELEKTGFEPGILVNNAGFGLMGPVAQQDTNGQLGILDVNIRALTSLTLKYLPAIERSGGGILNVASTAAFLPGPGMAVYYASKAYVLSFGEALAEEMRSKNVTVTTLCPGPTSTDFFARAGAGRSGLHGLAMMSSKAVAEAGYRGLIAGKRVVVPGLFNKLTSILAPLTPNALLLPIVHRMQRSRI